MTPDPATGAGTLEQTGTDELLELGSPWITIVWNDPVNLMSYVTYVFQTYFGFPRREAERLMMLVHTEGRAVVAEALSGSSPEWSELKALAASEETFLYRGKEYGRMLAYGIEEEGRA